MANDKLVAFAAIGQIASVLGPIWAFDIYDAEDIEQEAWVYGLQAISHYRGHQSVYDFLYVHIRNRLMAFKYEKLRPRRDNRDERRRKYIEGLNAWTK